MILEIRTNRGPFLLRRLRRLGPRFKTMRFQGSGVCAVPSKFDRDQHFDEDVVASYAESSSLLLVIKVEIELSVHCSEVRR